MSEANRGDRRPSGSRSHEGGVGAPSLRAPADTTESDVESVLAKLDSLWESEPPEVPSWAAQELTFGQLRLLFLLHGRGPVAMSGIADWLHVGLPTASGVADRLERHGLVQRRHRLDDRRIVECALTEDGRRLLDDIVGMRSEAIRRVLGVLSVGELSQLDHLLQVVIDRTTAPGPLSNTSSASPAPVTDRASSTSPAAPEETQ